MRRRLPPAALLAAALAAAGVQAADAPAGPVYRVQEVVSGDTFKLASGALVRYASAVAPDLMSSSKDVENYAKESLAFNRQLLEGRSVRLEWGGRIRDAQGHYLAYVYLEDGTFLNLEVLKAGFAKLGVEAPNLEHAEALERAAREARKEKRGLWRHERDRHVWEEAFVGNTMNREFHYGDCPEIADVPLAHRRPFGSPVEAKTAGFEFCKLCKHAAKQETSLF